MNLGVEVLIGSFITYTRTSYESLEDYLEYED